MNQNESEEQLTKTPDTAVARPPVETLIFKTEPQKQYYAVFREFGSIVKDIYRSKNRRYLFLMSATIGGVLLINMVAQIYLNRWLGGFYRAIEKRDLALIGGELVVFAELIAILLSVVVAQTFLHERFKIRLREWFSHRLLDDWLLPGRAYRLGISSDDAVNPDQRIQEDVRNFSEMSADLGIGLVQALLMLFSFIGVLWGMSKNIYFVYDHHQFTVPGYMVWVAILYALVGSWLTALVGRPLIPLNEKRYANEAALRFAIIRVSESSESVAFYSGERDERQIINLSLNRVLEIMGKISFGLARLTWITSGYGWLMLVLPVLVALPGFLQGTLDWGGLMMVVGAFNQVSQSLKWFVDNFARIADWRAAMHRVVVFRDAVTNCDVYENPEEQIQLLPHPDGHLSFEKTKVSLVEGDVVIADATAHVLPGERVLITGESGSGKSTLFRAVGGLWPWGAGIIRLPPKDQIMFLPQRPYMPLGTLADALTYPNHGLGAKRETMENALRRVNLAEFIPMLDVQQRWDKLMSLGQQQRLAFGRLLMHRPKWVFLDEATSAMDDDNQAAVMSLFTEDLAGTTVLSIGHRPNLVEFHTRTLQLVHAKEGTILRRRPKPPQRPRFWTRVRRRLTV